MIKLKNILSEGYAWERQAGKPLPTLKDVQEAYDAKGVEEAAPTVFTEVTVIEPVAFTLPQPPVNGML